MRAYDRQNSAYRGLPGAREEREAFEEWVKAGMSGTFEEWAGRYTVKR